MAITVQPMISRITIEFPKSDSVLLRIYGYRVVKETGEDPLEVPIESRAVLVPKTNVKISGFLSWVLGQAKKEFSRDDIEFGFPEGKKET